jgi:enoyl-CoA hydratase
MKYDDFQFLKFDPKTNGVLLITINRPDVMNATNGRLHWELTKIWDIVMRSFCGRYSAAWPKPNTIL